MLSQSVNFETKRQIVIWIRIDQPCPSRLCACTTTKTAAVLITFLKNSWARFPTTKLPQFVRAWLKTLEPSSWETAIKGQVKAHLEVPLMRSLNSHLRSSCSAITTALPTLWPPILTWLITRRALTLETDQRIVQSLTSVREIWQKILLLKTAPVVGVMY